MAIDPHRRDLFDVGRSRRGDAKGATIDARALQGARLRGERSHGAFDVLLTTLARPGTVASMLGVGLPVEVPPALVLPLALADVGVGCAVVGGPRTETWESLIVDVTGATIGGPAEASLVVLLEGATADDVLGLRRGTALDPHEGAKVAIACGSLRAGIDHHPTIAASRHPQASEPLLLALDGPGVDGRRHLEVGGLDPSIVGALSDANAGYPAGIDCWLVTLGGDVAALARSTAISVRATT